MRVIAGTARGVTLNSPDGTDVRPTSDRVRESLFNILAPVINDSTFLDLFAGTGAVGIEALSRGAAGATFIDAASAGLIKANLAKAHLQSNAIVMMGDYSDALEKCKRNYTSFDIIYIDPPYFQNLAQDSLKLIAAGSLLNKYGVAIVEVSRDENPPTEEGFTVCDVRRYGKTKLIFYKQGD
jgi:16S rRNA (guanine(966)-N(2))-methyltransferase RsmD